MGRKSREKRERRKAREAAKASHVGKHFLDMLGHTEPDQEYALEFEKKVNALKDLFHSFNPVDIAIAISISDLWIKNISSPIKHMYAWAVLADKSCSFKGEREIKSYEEFRDFLSSLYSVFPEFPMLEDFLPEADWGTVRIRLGDSFVPMFYGSGVERTPDFVEAFRISFAGNKQALADMDLAIAVQNCVLSCVDHTEVLEHDNIPLGHIEVPPYEFWRQCKKTLLIAQAEVERFLNSSSRMVSTDLGKFEAPLKHKLFGDYCLRGLAFPFVGVSIGEYWIPSAIRNGPGHVIDLWAAQEGLKSTVSLDTHQALSKYISSRFREVIPGPLSVRLGGQSIKLPISCVISGKQIYIVIACLHSEIPVIEKVLDKLYRLLKNNEVLEFVVPNGQSIGILSNDGRKPTFEEVCVVLTTLQSGTSMGIIETPKPPTRLLPLADMISIFDSVKEVNEIAPFWEFVNEQNSLLNPLSRAPADLFASYKQFHGLLVEGAISPDMIMLDPHSGSSWRFEELVAYWENAPRRFPNSYSAWVLDKTAQGVSIMSSRNRPMWGYSAEVKGCTIQFLMHVHDGLKKADAHLLDLFVQAVSDCVQRNREIIAPAFLCAFPHIIFQCDLDPMFNSDTEIATSDIEEPLITSFTTVLEESLVIRPKINLRAVQIGLSNAIDASFEVQCVIAILDVMAKISGVPTPDIVIDKLNEVSKCRPRFYIKIAEQSVDVPDFVEPIVPSQREYKLARKKIAENMHDLDISPGRYELGEAKEKIDFARNKLGDYINSYLEQFSVDAIVDSCIKQHDALLFRERSLVQRVQQSLQHEVDYDRLEAIAEARKDFGEPAKHYRYILEKVISSDQIFGTKLIDDVDLREMIGLVDWFMVLAGASDTLHNGIDVGGVIIDESYIPQVFYADDWEIREKKFSRESAKIKLGLDDNKNDSVEGNAVEHLDGNALRDAFRQDLGFELMHMLQSLLVLSQPVCHGLLSDLSFSYSSTPEKICDLIEDAIKDEVSKEEISKIVDFLTLESTQIRRLAGRESIESDVPFWEHSKRVFRYAIRPLVPRGGCVIWGAEQASRSMNIWMSAVRDGYLPCELSCPNIDREIKNVKKKIEKDLEIAATGVCARYTPYVEMGVDFYRRFRKEGFEDIGDFDVLAYWPEENVLVSVECKYNQPPYSFKDSRRLRDKIFGKNESDRNGHVFKILRRNQFLEAHRSKLISLLGWPEPCSNEISTIDLYVSLDTYWWMVHPPYDVEIEFVRVEALDLKLKSIFD